MSEPRGGPRGGPSPRRLWTLLEPVHAITYFAAQSRLAYEEAGLRGFWRGYFAGRSAPLGRVGPAPVIALFYGFAPSMVRRALPSVWTMLPPEAALAARERGAVAALGALEPDGGHDPARYAEAAALARQAVEAADLGGRALGAANAWLPWPEDPLASLWHAATVLRELRGDGHVSALLTSGLTGLEALVLRAGLDLNRQLLQPARGWADDEWVAAATELTVRGLLDIAGKITDAGRALLADVESLTDHLAAQPWAALPPDDVTRFAQAIAPLSMAAAAELPSVNAIGLPPRSP